MASDDSDDEPLSVIAALKKQDNLELGILPETNRNDLYEKQNDEKDCELPVEVQNLFGEETNPVVERPTDVWLYLKDFNASGPYSCLLCAAWFVNKAKIIIHYVINHQKDYCGICRYFVPSRDAWWNHLKFHMPWKCSQCTETFVSQTDLRKHFSSAHKLIHCRLCYLRLPDDEQYNTHLYQKHSVTNVSTKYNETFWDFEHAGYQKFLCLLCAKPSNVGRPFADHFLAYHHFTLKCFMFLISGTDLPLSVKGVELSQEFIETELKDYGNCGYVDFDIPIAIKQEPLVEIDEIKVTVEFEQQLKQEDPIVEEEDLKLSEELKAYKGDEDFDVTLVELIVMQKCYFEYINETVSDINSNVMPLCSDIKYVNTDDDLNEVSCCLCREKFLSINMFTSHMIKMHFVKILPTYTCRVCDTVFDTINELESHSAEEMGEFEDLWLCQFCDKEFDNRIETRKHLTSHWSMIEYDNCFSPHLGFKCRFCPTLFWNETDRETHHVRAHFQKHRSDFYGCSTCDELFGDKVWFMHHYLEKHNTQETYLLKCCICSLVLLNIDDMRRHFEANHPEARKIFCSIDTCQYKPFSHKKSFQLHLKAMHNPANRAPRSATCNICGVQFNSARACSTHMSQKHGPGKFKCTLCKEVLQTSDERKLHYLIRHPGRYQYQCDMCDKSFQYKSSLYMHKQDHSPNKKHFTCTYCGKVFMKKDSYREHVHIHQAPRHACSYCPMRFVQRSNMLRHERRHTGERPYACKLCPRTFADKGACNSHARTHLKDRSFECMYCGQSFVQKSKLTYHIRKHTGENLETCSICSKIFTSACSLREHMKTHIKQKMKKTIKCSLCKRMFPDEKDLARHTRIKHSGVQYKCPLCRKSLCSASSLREHVVTHSRLKTYLCCHCPSSFHAKKTAIKHLQIRHNLTGIDVRIRDHYRHLDPRECNLGLSEEVILSIFGSNKKRKNVIIKDHVTVNINQPVNNNENSQNSMESRDKSSEESQCEEIVTIKVEPAEYEEQQQVLSPDFVNVKIESVNEQSDAEMN